MGIDLYLTKYKRPLEGEEDWISKKENEQSGFSLIPGRTCPFPGFIKPWNGLPPLAGERIPPYQNIPGEPGWKQEGQPWQGLA